MMSLLAAKTGETEGRGRELSGISIIN